MYKVIKFFADLQDKNHAYNVGDIFPRKGVEVTAERYEELAGNDNKQGQPLIRLVEEQKEESAAQKKKAAPKKKKTDAE